MKTVGAFEVKTHFSALLEQVEHVEQIIITKHGHPVAKIVPIHITDHDRIKQVIQQIKELNKLNIVGDLDWKSLRDEGRK